MAREKKPVHKVQMTEGKREIIQKLLQEYEIQSAQDIQEALKDLLGGTIKEMMEAEMDSHLGYQKSERSDSDDYRNGYKSKQVNSSYGSMKIEVPQDRKSTFQPQVVKKRQKDISDIDQKIISMYAKGMTTRQISDTLYDIYGFEASESFISDVTDKIMPQIEEWQNRPLSEVYPVLYIDAIHYSVRDNGIIRKLAAYIILGINSDGYKEVLTIEVGENESSKYWLSVLNGLKNRGVSDILIICADGLTGIKEAIAAQLAAVLSGQSDRLECLFDQVLFSLCNGGFLLIEDRLAPAFFIFHIVIHTGITQIQTILDDLVGVYPVRTIGIICTRISPVYTFSLDVPISGMPGKMNFNLPLGIVWRLQEFKHELCYIFLWYPCSTKTHTDF